MSDSDGGANEELTGSQGADSPSPPNGAAHGGDDPVAAAVERAAQRLAEAQRLGSRTPGLTCNAEAQNGKGRCGKGPHPTSEGHCEAGHLMSGNALNGVSDRRHLANHRPQVEAEANRLLVDIGHADPTKAPGLAQRVARRCAEFDLLIDRSMSGNGQKNILKSMRLLDQYQQWLKWLYSMRVSPSSGPDPALQQKTLEEFLEETAALHESIARTIGVETRLRPVIDAWLASGPATPEDGPEPGPEGPGSKSDRVGGCRQPEREAGNTPAPAPLPAAIRGAEPSAPPDTPPKSLHDLIPSTTPEALYPNVTEQDVRETLRNEGDEVLDAYDRGRLLKFEAYSRADARLKQIRQITGSRPPKTPA